MILSKVPRKIFEQSWQPKLNAPIILPDLSIIEALDRVLKLPSVASKRYLTNKVDRSVTGQIAQQQCVGPLHTPLSDVAVTVVSLFDTVINLNSSVNILGVLTYDWKFKGWNSNFNW